MSVRLELQLATPADGVVRGTVFVREGGRSRGLSVALLYREYRGKSKRSTGSGHESRVLLASGDLVTGAEYDFSLAFPESPWPAYACAVTGTRLRWEVEAKVDQPGLDERVSASVDVQGERLGALT